LKVGDRIGGHFITGHVDGTGEILSIEKKGEEQVFSIQVPRDLTVYLAYKGSIAIEGVSLTLGKFNRNLFEVYIIPYTLAHTNLGMKKTADQVNLEVDILARYVLSSNSEGKSKITEKFLKEQGF
jgi:riboflavin synthase